ncbi:MAG: dihydroorotate dehydrogenase electron transfer subunit [Bacteroidales bacterium]|nr:dihydroorotate dehydrogenase electron transfer subunit [Bacteroidales bacterium]MBR5781515.1 dihydroorotate dehydrogenase electron transfer subunit [Bacteroidales bacterium]
MKKITDFRLIEKKEWAKSTYLLLQSDEPLEDIKAGQFVQVKVDDAANTYLRRPISIHDVDYQNRTITLLVQRVGEGTNKISDTEINDTLNIIYPLGNGFTMPEDKDAKVVLVGGGIGIAPMYYLGKVLKEKGLEPVFVLGGRSKEDLIMLDKFSSVGEVYITTNDGSLGEQGFVTQHSVWKEKKFDMIYTCGPKPMMMAVANLARENDICCEVSLENLMACGLGACLCCVENTIEGHVCVCKEGPVMNINKLLW